MTVELLETVKEAITAYTGLSPNAFFTVVASGIAVYYVVSVLFGGSSDHHPQHRPRSFEQDVKPLPPPVQLGEISEEELKSYDGNDPEKPLLMAIKGQIYDVSQSRMFYGPGGPYALFAGKDASRALAKMSFEEKDLNGDLTGLGSFELDALQDWEYKFMSKYVKVGSIKNPEAAAEAVPEPSTTAEPAAHGSEAREATEANEETAATEVGSDISTSTLHPPSPPLDITSTRHRLHSTSFNKRSCSRKSVKQVMEANNDNVVASDTSKKNKVRTLWDHQTFMVFIDLCMNEVKNGNRPSSHFNKVGWGNIEKAIKDRTGKSIDKKQLKKKWDNMKKEWKLYDRLMRIESGIGWDAARKTFDAPDEWWDEKIKGDKDIAKFRDLNLEIYQLYYEPLFRDSVAVGDKTKAPVECQNDSGPTNVEHDERRGDSDEVNLVDNDEPLFPQSSSSKRKNPTNITHTRSTKGKSSANSSYEDKLDTVLEALLSRSTQTFPLQKSSPTTQECMDIVTCFPGFEEGSRMYSQALRVFLKAQVRENFMVPTSHIARMEFLKLLMEKN